MPHGGDRRQITQHFGKLVEPHMPAVLQGVWKFFSESVKDYDAIIVRGDGDGA